MEKSKSGSQKTELIIPKSTKIESRTKTKLFLIIEKGLLCCPLPFPFDFMEALLTQLERLNSASSSVCALEEDREKTNSLISYSAHSLYRSLVSFLGDYLG